MSRGPSQCHDITTYPAAGLAAGACSGWGILFDITDPTNPQRINAVSDTNFSFWHSATFSNDGKMVMFTDEWGGGSAARCRETDNRAWGGNAIFSITNRSTMTFRGYYKLPVAQTELENCVAHNGSPIPIPGREVMIQGWYQGGLTVLDWTDPTRPYEIAFFDRGPYNSERLASAGSWSVYWYNGLLVSSEIMRGLDILELVPSPMLTQNEIDASKTVVLKELNAQEQPHLVFPPSFPLSRAYTDQLERSKGLTDSRIAAVRSGLASAERASGNARRQALTALASSLTADAAGSTDKAKLALLTKSLHDLAARR